MPRMFYVPRLTSAGALIDKTFVRAQDRHAARTKAQEFHKCPVEEIGPAQELSETYVLAMGIVESVK